MHKAKNWRILHVLSHAFLLLVAACSNPEPVALRTLTPKTNNTIAVCSAGLSERLSGKLEAIVDDGEASLTGSVEAKLKGAIFDDESIDSQAKVEIFEKYLICVKEIREETKLPANAAQVVQKDVNPAVWSRAKGWRGNSLAKINWSGDFKVSYYNSSDVTVSCTATVRGENQDRSTRKTLSVGQTESVDFKLGAGETYVFKGKIGAPGYTDQTRVVTYRNYLNCRYNQKNGF